MSGLRRRSWAITTTSSSVRPASISSVVTPIESARAKRGQRVLGRKSARAAVALEVEGGGVGGHERERGGEGGGTQHGLG